MQHIVAPFHMLNSSVWHDSIWIALELGKRFENAQIAFEFWSPEEANAICLDYRIQTIKPYQGRIPANGDLWIVGADVSIGNWYSPDRYKTVSVMYDEISADKFFRHLRKLNAFSSVNILYISHKFARETGVAGKIYEMDLIKNNVLLQGQTPDRQTNSKFTVGRVSPNSPEWHHPDDIALYKQLLEFDIGVKLFGGDCLKPWAGSDLPIEYRADTSRIEAAVLSLDCVVCRSTPSASKSFLPIINSAIGYNIPIITNTNNFISAHLKNYKKCYVLDSNVEIIRTIKVLAV